MRRRQLIEEPTSRFAIWARRLAVFALVVAALSVVIAYSDLLDFKPMLAAFATAVVVALGALLLALVAFVVIWRQGVRGLGHAVIAALIGLVLLAYPGYIAARGYRLPAIADITTDSQDPPRFDAVRRLRSSGSKPVEYAGLKIAEQQKDAYPDIEPLVLSVPAPAAFEAAMKVITARKWRIVDARAFQQGRREGHIEAVARTFILGLREDVSLRVRATPQGSRIDVRSASRFGDYDFGTNATRVRSLLEDIDSTADIDKDRADRAAERAARQAPKPAAKGQSVKR